MARIIVVATRTLRLALFGAALLAAPNALAATTVESTLATSDGNDLTASDFAKIMAQYLRGSIGESLIQDAKFLFEECFGGGMLPALQKALGNTIKWIGGSASRANEASWGAKGSIQSPTTALDYWTAALAPELKKPDQTVGDSLQKASDNDTHGPKGEMKETPQTTGSVDGSTIKMSDGKSHHAIIWTGAKDAQRHFNDITAVKDALNTAWAGAPNGNSITEVSTIDELKAAMQKLKDDGKLNTNEEFLFYVTDHGGQQTTIIPDKPKVAARTSDKETFSLDPGVIAAMLGSDPIQTPPMPTLDITYSGLTTFDQVSFNGHLLGFLDPSLTEMVFNLSISFLSLDNEIDIDNSASNSSDFFLNSKVFDTGAVNNSVPAAVPEPGTLALLGVGLWGLAGLRRRRPAAAR